MDKTLPTLRLKIRNERRDITNDITQTQRIIMDYYGQLKPE